jgi:ABC-type nickel/cobalt efflux system permease component RcnA
MFGFDNWVASLSDGTTLLIVIAVAVVLGLRHATDPDHLAAVTTLVASGKERQARRAGVLGLSWGLGHAASLFAFGLPIVLFKAYLPEGVQTGAETLVGLLIMVLAGWLLLRWRRGVFHVHVHAHGGGRHAHVHDHAHRDPHAHAGARPVRTRTGAFGIGLVHGMGGSAGVGVLLLATIHSHAVAVVALAFFAFFTAISMALLSTGFGLTLATAPVRRSFAKVAPALGFVSLLFGLWYALGAQGLLPYYF